MDLPTPPATLPPQLHSKWTELAALCRRLGTLSPCACSTLEQYVMLSWEYEAITPNVVAAIQHGDALSADRWISAQAKLERQLKCLSNRLGLNTQAARARGLHK